MYEDTIAAVPEQPENNVPKKPKRWPWIVGIVAALIVGGAIGASGSSTDTKTKTVTVTSIVTNDVVSTPDACTTALDQADKLFGITSDFATTAADTMGAASDGFTAIANGDIAGANSVVDRVKANTEAIQNDTSKVEAIVPVYRSARDECESS